MSLKIVFTTMTCILSIKIATILEAERLFSYIVMQNYEEAYNVINNLKSFEVSPFLEVSILNAEKLMAEQILKLKSRK